MYKDKKILAVITARGGSKGLPGKNIKPMLGKPLIAWTIGQGLNSKYIDKLIVSTDDKEIADVAKKYGAEVPFMRPDYLASDTASSMDVIIHAIDFFEKKDEFFDIVVILEPTSPLRNKNDLDNALKLFVENFEEADSLISLGEIHLESPFFAKILSKNGFIESLMNIAKVGRRQDLQKTYFPYGVIYATKVNLFKNDKLFYREKTLPYYIQRWQNYEIDDIFDFVCIENILRLKMEEVE
jgi:CMP-N-acetylneuraminic acid synthetase